MFKINVTVPRITKDQVEQLEATIPGLLTFVTIPTVEHVEQAQKQAFIAGNKLVDYREYVDRVESVTETEKGWDFQLICMGD